MHANGDNTCNVCVMNGMNRIEKDLFGYEYFSLTVLQSSADAVSATINFYARNIICS